MFPLEDALPNEKMPLECSTTVSTSISSCPHYKVFFWSKWKQGRRRNVWALKPYCYFRHSRYIRRKFSHYYLLSMINFPVSNEKYQATGNDVAVIRSSCRKTSVTLSHVASWFYRWVTSRHFRGFGSLLRPSPMMDFRQRCHSFHAAIFLHETWKNFVRLSDDSTEAEMETKSWLI